MVRVAVRTLTLNIYRVDDPALRTFILDRSAVPYFSNLVWFIRDQCISLDRFIQGASYLDVGKVRSKVEQQIDHFYYLQDILNLQMDAMSRVLSDQFLAHFVFPVLVASFLPSNIKKELDAEHKISNRVAQFFLTQIFDIFSNSLLIQAIASSLLHPNISALASTLISHPPIYPVLGMLILI